MNNYFYYDRAKKLREEGSSLATIRTYLENSGVPAEEVSTIFRRIDNEEIDELYKKQRLSKARNELITSLVILIIGIIFNVYEYIREGKTELFLFLIPLSLFFTLWIRFKNIKKKHFSTSAILKESRKNR